MSPEPVLANDTSCLVDLGKVNLLEPFFQLEHRFLVSILIRKELAGFFYSKQLKILKRNLDIHPLEPENIELASSLAKQKNDCSAEDCSCIYTAKDHKNCILLTGDKKLRKRAKSMGVQVHGVLWVIDELRKAGVCSDAGLKAALESWKQDPTVYLEAGLIDEKLKGFR